MLRANLNEYYKIFARILYLTIFMYPNVVAVACISIALTIASTYYAVKISDAISDVTKSFKTSEFDLAMKTFVLISLLAVSLRFAPKIIYTYTLQETCRKKFVYFLKEYLSLKYTDFNTKSPGELRFLIFLKTYSSVMSTNLVVFESSLLLGTVIFSFIKIRGDVNIASAIVFLTIPFLYMLCIFYYISLKICYQNELLKQQEFTSMKVYDKLLNYEIIKTYNLEQAETDSLHEILGQQVKAQVDMSVFDAKSFFILNCILGIPYVIIVWLYTIDYSSMHSIDLFKATILYAGLASQLKRLGREFSNLIMYINQIKYAEIKMSIEDTSNQNEIKEFNNNVEFKNLTIFYKDFPVIKNINAQIKKGEKIAILGKNGTGKSTFIKTILGFTKYEGDMFIDGKNVKDLTNKSILKLISYIPQDDYTADDTVMENIKRGNPSATNEEIVEVCKTFGAHDYFKNLENGYETEVGPRGNKLSGGQKQKLSIVRAAIKDGEIFILDEATASMDKNYENRLMPVLFKNLKDKTVIMIVHGKEHLAKFDRIFFFNEAALEATGSYDELIKNNENFRKLADYCNS